MLLCSNHAVVVGDSICPFITFPHWSDRMIGRFIPPNRLGGQVASAELRLDCWGADKEKEQGAENAGRVAWRQLRRQERRRGHQWKKLLIGVGQ